MAKHAGDAERSAGFGGEGTDRSDGDQPFQRPDPEPALKEPLRFNEHAARAVPADAQVDRDGPRPSPAMPGASSAPRHDVDFEDRWHEAIEKAMEAVPAPAQGSSPAPVRFDPAPFPAPPSTMTLRSDPVEWLKLHRFGLAFGLLALLAIAEGIYILRTDRAPAAGSATAAATDAPAAAAVPPVAPPVGDPGGPLPSGSPGAVAAPTTGHLTIRSDPSGAAVSIDGRYYGVTPLILAAALPGDRQVVLKLAGREVQQTVRVEPGGVASVIAPMGSAAPAAAAAPSGWVSVTSRVELDILEDGVLIGSTRSPKVMMLAGAHTLRLVNETLGYDATQKIRVEAGKVAQLSVALPDTTIQLNAQPWAEVFIDGKPVGETPIGNVPIQIGTHRIVFRHPELGEKTVSTIVKVGPPTRVTVDLRK